MPQIGLALIVKNEAEYIQPLLDSVAGHVDAVVLCDTGSTDDTVKVFKTWAKKVGLKGDQAKVVNFKWVDDFSKARQASFDAIPDWCDFTLWADADDVIKDAEQLREIAAHMNPAVLGTIHRYDYARDPNGNCICELWRERLVRNHIGAKWELPIHEVQSVPGTLVRSDYVEWVHRHPEGRPRDPERNYKVLSAFRKQQLADGVKCDPRTLAYLGTEAMALGRPEEAEECFREYLDRHDTSWDDERAQVAHKLSIVLRSDGDARLIDSEAAALQSIQYRPDWPDGLIDLAEIALRRDEPERALRYCEQAAIKQKPDTLLIINPLEYEYQVPLMQSVALAKLGRHKEAFELTQKVLPMAPEREDVRAQYTMLFEHIKSAEAEEMILTLRQILVRHDENEKASKLMECVPYFALSRPAIAEAKLDQREMTLHLTDPDVYARYYRDNPGETPFEAQQVPIEKAHERFDRVNFLRKGLAKQAEQYGRDLSELSVLDLSANDGWCAANLSEFGVGVIDCMDLNADAAERARGRRLKYPAIGRVICDDLHHAAEHFDEHFYDAVVCFETIEHVPHPEKTLDVMAQMCAEDGRCYVSTPEGAFDRGDIPDWNKVETKSHLRAMRAQDVAQLVCERGIVEDWAMTDFLVSVNYQPVPRMGKIVFFCGGIEIGPESIIASGMGGSETATAKMAEHFARKGYDVRVYAGNGGGLRGDRVTVDGDEPPQGQVLYSAVSEWDPGEECDLFVSVRIPEVFDRSIAASNRVLWLHDAEYGDRLTPERLDRVSKVIVMSNFQATLFPEASDKIWVSRNGIETSFFGGSVVKNRSVVYSSSPDRGLDVLLECWPEVVKQVPEAELHHTYAPIYHVFREAYPHLQQFHSKVDALISEAPNVITHTSMGQADLAQLYREARVWAYPSWNTPHQAAFPEISCISAMEAQAGGAIPVCLDYAALKETVVTGQRIKPKIRNGKLTKAWRKEFVEAIVRGLTDDEWLKQCSQRGIPYALDLDWSLVADEWEEVLLKERQKVPA